MTAARVLRQRLAAQHLSSRALASAAEVVSHLTCVQSQEPTVAPYSLGLRMRRASQQRVWDELSSGTFVRTHILRPTWHYVAADDLRWIQAATAPRVLQMMAGRYRQLEIDDALVSALEDVLLPLLAEAPLTRRQIAAEASARGLELPGERLGHSLMTLELRAVICSGPMAGTAHTYRIVDDDSPLPFSGDAALRELARRFYRGHGPASIGDFARWASLTKTQAAAATHDAGDALERIVVRRAELYVDPAYSPPLARRPRTMLLPLFDEALLTSPDLPFTQPESHPHADLRYPWTSYNPGAGIVLHRGANVGAWWREFPGDDTVRITLRLASGLSADDRPAIEQAAERYAAFLGRTLTAID
ncbi:hypothetical protein EK0264_01925 [Epidermidibacterium keratini]|uniref:Winged helix DNA-binding domain-containing protein n=1 Tax=Epidermidibacterium keratini TaxID=1891644 RepID=A0A7L4YJA4_9ACTN|nr:winged helix DNA-binding domain-containing protein [Epidermidibacterium keratini]QHB99167.1 hypothetical protein EK0264_01925 [Epidermidibacterium keratini]